MSTTDIKQVVKEKYGQAAARVQSGKSTLLRWAILAGGLLRPDHLESVRRRGRRGTCRRRRFWPRSAAEIRRRSHSSIPAKRFSISVPAAASTFCSPRAVSGRPAKPTAST